MITKMVIYLHDTCPYYDRSSPLKRMSYYWYYTDEGIEREVVVPEPYQGPKD